LWVHPLHGPGGAGGGPVTVAVNLCQLPGRAGWPTTRRYEACGYAGISVTDVPMAESSIPKLWTRSGKRFGVAVGSHKKESVRAYAPSDTVKQILSLAVAEAERAGTKSIATRHIVGPPISGLMFGQGSGRSHPLGGSYRTSLVPINSLSLLIRREQPQARPTFREKRTEFAMARQTSLSLLTRA